MPIQFPIPLFHDDHHRRRRSNRHAEGQNNPPQSPTNQSYPKSNFVSESNTRKVLCLFLKCIIMTFILSLFLVFIGFAAIVLLHFLLLTATTSACRGRRRRSQRQTQHYFSVTENNVLFLQDVENLLPRIRYVGLEESVIDCVICLESFDEEDSCRKLPGCHHLFHVNCVDNWLIKVPNCPVCRNPVRLATGRVGPIYIEDDWRVWWPVGR